MSESFVRRIEGARVGIVAADSATQTTVDPAPLVLNSSRERPVVVSFTQVVNVVEKTIEQRLERLNWPGARSSVGGGAYPIVFRGDAATDEQAARLNAFEPGRLLVADVTGDGSDELIVATALGGVRVYSRDAQLFEYRPPVPRTELYAYEVLSPHVARLPGREVVFHVVNRRLRRAVSDLAEDDRAYHARSAAVALLMVDAQGVTSINLAAAEGRRVTAVYAVAALNRPGSKVVDELLVCHGREGVPGTWLGRYTLEGALVAAPREVYADPADPAGLTFAFTPECDEVVAFCGSERRAYFFSPAKPANWCRVVEVGAVLGDEVPPTLLGAVAVKERAVAVLRAGAAVYAIDAQGTAYRHNGRGFVPRADAGPCLELARTDRHELAVVSRAGGRVEEGLFVVTSRHAGARALSEADVHEASERFLPDALRERCREDAALRFSDTLAERARNYCVAHGMAVEEVTSLDDLKTKVPDFYDALAQDERRRYASRLERQLLLPLHSGGSEGVGVDGLDRRNKAEYAAWLGTLRVPAETRLCVIGLDGRVRTAYAIEGLAVCGVHSRLSASRAWYGVACDAGHVAVLALSPENAGGEAGEAALYAVEW